MGKYFTFVISKANRCLLIIKNCRVVKLADTPPCLGGEGSEKVRFLTLTTS